MTTTGTAATIDHYHVVHGTTTRIGVNVPTLDDARALADAVAVAGHDVEIWAVRTDGWTVWIPAVDSSLIYHGAGQACADVAIGHLVCLGHAPAAPSNTDVKTGRDGIWQERVGASGDVLYRYCCDRCGHTGRWVKNGNLVQEAYETHRYGSIDDGASRCR